VPPAWQAPTLQAGVLRVQEGEGPSVLMVVEVDEDGPWAFQARLRDGGGEWGAHYHYFSPLNRDGGGSAGRSIHLGWRWC